MKIYTRTGDDGSTGLYGHGRIAKDSSRIEALGDLDELNASLGCALSATIEPGLAERLREIQGMLFRAGAEIGSRAGRLPEVVRLGNDSIEKLEAWIDEMDSVLEPLRTFILPGGSRAGAGLHAARALARRTERSFLRWLRDESDGERDVLRRFFNRLSDFLFVAARHQNRFDESDEVGWLPPV